MSLTSEALAWLAGFERSLMSKSRHAIDGLLSPEVCWRDAVALSWDTHQFWGRDAVSDSLLRYAETSGLANMRLDDERTPPRLIDFLGSEVSEIFFAFDTTVGWGKGIVRLVADESSPTGSRALMIGTSLTGLRCAPEPHERHPRSGFDPQIPGQTWREWTSRAIGPCSCQRTNGLTGWIATRPS